MKSGGENYVVLNNVSKIDQYSFLANDTTTTLMGTNTMLLRMELLMQFKETGVTRGMMFFNMIILDS